MFIFENHIKHIRREYGEYDITQEIILIGYFIKIVSNLFV